MQNLLQCVQSGFEEEALSELDRFFSEQINQIRYTPEINHLCHRLLAAYLQKMDSMHVELERQQFLELVSFDSAESLKEKLAEHITKVCELVRNKRKGSNDQLKEKILAYVDGHFKEPGLTLMAVSDHFRLSVYFCSRLFKESAGIGFKEYINVRRMESAKELLLFSDKSVSEIAKSSGFENPTYFMTRFKAMYGMSPSSFRQSAQETMAGRGQSAAQEPDEDGG